MENQNLHQGEGGFEKELGALEEEIELEKQRLSLLKKEVQLEEKQVEHLDEELQHLREEHEHHSNTKTVKLIFIVNGTPVNIIANENWPLKQAAELALEKSGNANRPIADWSVKRGNNSLDLQKKIEAFHFKDCEELLMSLNAGQGGC